MPTVRIRTHDPDAVSFFTAKLADCGFDVEFASPGQKVRGEVDLEITINYTRKAAAARRNTRTVAQAGRAAQARVEWTTPYHAEAPELADELAADRNRLNDASQDRDLARILAGQSQRGEMFVIGIRDEVPAESVPEPQDFVQIPVPTPRPALVSTQPKVAPAPKFSKPSKRVQLPQHTFLQRHAAFAAAFILPAAVIIFYLSLFGNPNPATDRTDAPTVSAQTSTQTPANAPVSAPTPNSAPEARSAVPAAAPTSATTAKHKASHHRASRPRTATPQQDEPEVTVRHFPEGLE